MAAGDSGRDSQEAAKLVGCARQCDADGMETRLSAEASHGKGATICCGDAASIGAHYFAELTQ
jgi:hypothetical protein